MVVRGARWVGAGGETSPRVWLVALVGDLGVLVVVLGVLGVVPVVVCL